MSELQCGIVGLPNVGKSTLFNALTRTEADVANYPFCTIEPNVGIVNVPDPRVNTLTKLTGSKKSIHAATKFVDIAGLVEGAHKGEGLGNQFLSHIREVDAICHVVRCFENSQITHVSGKVDPVSDIEIIHTELTLADLQMCENILPKLEKRAKADPKIKETIALLQRIKKHLEEGSPVRNFEINAEEKVLLKPYPFLTAKKVLYVANVLEEDLPSMDNAHVQKLRKYAEKENAIVVPICAKIEEEIAQLSEEETQEFIQSIGLESAGLDRLIRASYHLLDLVSYFTTGEMESRAWTIPRNTLAPQAAGVIHSDFEKGFIRAEVVSFDELIQVGSRAKAKEAGLVRLEGKEYMVQDGDVILFHTN